MWKSSKEATTRVPVGANKKIQRAIEAIFTWPFLPEESTSWNLVRVSVCHGFVISNFKSRRTPHIIHHWKEDDISDDNDDDKDTHKNKCKYKDKVYCPKKGGSRISIMTRRPQTPRPPWPLDHPDPIFWEFLWILGILGISGHLKRGRVYSSICSESFIYLDLDLLREFTNSTHQPAEGISHFFSSTNLLRESTYRGLLARIPSASRWMELVDSLSRSVHKIKNWWIW